MKKLILGLIAAVLCAACVPPAPTADQYAGIIVVYADGKPINSRVLELTDSYEKCAKDVAKIVADAGSPPIGVTAELSCVQVAPFLKLSGTGVASHSAPPLPHTDSI